MHHYLYFLLLHLLILKKKKENKSNKAIKKETDIISKFKVFKVNSCKSLECLNPLRGGGGGSCTNYCIHFRDFGHDHAYTHGYDYDYGSINLSF